MKNSICPDRSSITERRYFFLNHTNNYTPSHKFGIMDKTSATETSNFVFESRHIQSFIIKSRLELIRSYTKIVSPSWS